MEFLKDALAFAFIPYFVGSLLMAAVFLGSYGGFVVTMLLFCVAVFPFHIAILSFYVLMASLVGEFNCRMPIYLASATEFVVVVVVLYADGLLPRSLKLDYQFGVLLYAPLIVCASSSALAYLRFDGRKPLGALFGRYGSRMRQVQ